MGSIKTMLILCSNLPESKNHIGRPGLIFTLATSWLEPKNIDDGIFMDYQKTNQLASIIRFDSIRSDQMFSVSRKYPSRRYRRVYILFFNLFVRLITTYFLRAISKFFYKHINVYVYIATAVYIHF